MKRLILASLTLVAATSWASQLISGSNQPLDSKQVGRQSCYRFANGTVISQEKESEAGENIWLQTANNNCRLSRSARQVTTSDPTTAAFFVGVTHTYLLIDHGTGPDHRQLELIGINDQHSHLKLDYIDEVKIIGPQLTWWQPLTTPAATKGNCPNYQKINQLGLTPVLAIHATVNLAKQPLTVQKGQRKQCFASQ